MKTFYTITDYTEYTNSRSKRFSTVWEAKEAARERIQGRPHDNTGVIVMKAICQIRPKIEDRPVVEEPMEETA